MLDFSALNNDVPKSPTRPAKGETNINIPAELKTQPAGLIGAKYGEQRKNEHKMNLLDLGRLLNERLGRAELTIAEYNKAIKANRPPEEIALLAAKALSLAVSEELIYKNLERHYQDLGIRVTDTPPYTIIHDK